MTIVTKEVLILISGTVAVAGGAMAAIGIGVIGDAGSGAGLGITGISMLKPGSGADVTVTISVRNTGNVEVTDVRFLRDAVYESAGITGYNATNPVVSASVEEGRAASYSAPIPGTGAITRGDRLVVTVSALTPDGDRIFESATARVRG